MLSYTGLLFGIRLHDRQNACVYRHLQSVHAVTGMTGDWQLPT